MACPKCGKCVPQRYRESHATMHLDGVGDVKYVPVPVASCVRHYKNMWEALKHAAKVEEENKNKSRRLLRPVQ